MLANVKLLGYNGKVKIINETEKGYELEMLEGKYKGTHKRVFLSKSSKVETITFNKPKFTSKIEYNVSKYKDDITNEVTETYREFYLTIISSSKELSEKIWNNFYDYVCKNSYLTNRQGCPASGEANNNKYYFWDCISVYDKAEYEELKEIYKEWKKQ